MARETARDAVMGAVRSHLKVAREAEPAPAPLDPTRARSGRSSLTEDAAARLARFKATLESVGGRVTVAQDAIGAAAALRHVFATRRVRRCARTGDPDVERLIGTLANVQWIDPADRAALLECDAGLTGVQWAIAETGSLVLSSSDERHRLASLVPPVHVALLRSTRILGALDDAFASVATGDPAAMARAVTLITGPSRTADIELTLVVGVHGPKELHVIVLEEDDA